MLQEGFHSQAISTITPTLRRRPTLTTMDRKAPTGLALLTAACAALILFPCALASVYSSPGSATGTLMVMSWSLAGGGDEHEYYLQMDNGELYSVAFCDEITEEDIIPNSRVKVFYSKKTGGVLHSCQRPVQEGQASQTRRLLFGNTISAPTRPTFLVYIATLCGYKQPAAATEKNVMDLFAGPGLAFGRSISGYYNTCSYGQVGINSSQVKVLGPLDIPCSGSLSLSFTYPSGNNFDTASCDNQNLYKWQWYLDSLAKKEGVNPSDYHHKIILMPRGYFASMPGCKGISGAGSVGPALSRTANNTWGTAIAWISGDVLSNVELWVHEVGHNIGMAHADVPGGCDLVDQCDHTCVMGARGGQGVRCPNAPHMWQLGWGRPFLQLADSDLRHGSPVSVAIPPQMTSPNRTSVAVRLTGMAVNERLYVAARINLPPYDLPYGSIANGRPFLTVHSYSGVSTNYYLRTTLLENFGLGDTFLHTASNLLISFTEWDAQDGAAVLFCRRLGAKEQTCGDGLDDDCDFLPDHLDPDCAGRMPPLPSVPAQPPSPGTPASPSQPEPFGSQSGRVEPPPTAQRPAPQPRPPPPRPRSPPRPRPPPPPSPSAPLDPALPSNPLAPEPPSPSPVRPPPRRPPPPPPLTSPKPPQPPPPSPSPPPPRNPPAPPPPRSPTRSPPRKPPPVPSPATPRVPRSPRLPSQPRSPRMPPPPQVPKSPSLPRAPKMPSQPKPPPQPPRFPPPSPVRSPPYSPPPTDSTKRSRLPPTPLIKIWFG